MALTVGERLGPYEILALIGAGGMGEVYRARDPRLNRDVAIKVSRERFSDRFEREARAVAALNHPNICTLYDVGPDYLVMEFIEGESPKGPLPLEETLRIARQIADALEAAHEKGIVHRDLKPGNIKIKPDGAVKVLDFGLAKTAETASGDPQSSPTMTISPTRAGMILGTAAYMSPEQARGRPVDKRADIWAFGVVLYELLTGRGPFHGEDITEIVASVVKEEPRLEGIPPQVRRLLKSCLEKDPKNRLRDIGDAWNLLQEMPHESPLPLLPTRRWLWPGVAAVLLAALGAILSLHIRETPPELPALRVTILPPDNTTLEFTNGLGLPAISPDGRRIVFGARTADGKTSLWVRPLDALTAQPLAGTEGATFPFWSPDSRFIAFFAGGKLKRMNAAGGPAITLADAPAARGGSWSPLGVIIFDPGIEGIGRIHRVSASGGAATPLSAGRLPWFLPDGRHLVYQLQQQANPTEVTIRVGSLSGAAPTQDRQPGKDGAEDKPLFQANSNAVFSQGHLLFLREGTLMAQPFDLKRLVTTGEAVPVAEGVQGVLNTETAGVFAVSETGLLAYHGGADSRRVLTWFDRGGKPEATVGLPVRRFGGFRLSPDQKSLAVSLADASDARSKVDIWIYDLARGGLRTPLTFDGAFNDNPVWSPDGRAIAYSSLRKGHWDLYRKSADGAGPEQLIYADDLYKVPTSWSPDGKFLLYYTGHDRIKSDVWALPLTPDQPGGTLKPFPVVQTRFSNSRGQFSPDGRWIAYTSIASRRPEIYATPFPPGAGGKRLISSALGVSPKWRPDGKAILYLSIPPGPRLMTAEFPAGEARALFPVDLAGASAGFEVAADGQHFLIPVAPEQKSAEPLTLIQDWTSLLKETALKQ
ncbi:MAG TPA: protein kinase [Bryobacteraceae bacterium]|nr:protein kinase [Bryobacteraceae bacterium]